MRLDAPFRDLGRALLLVGLVLVVAGIVLLVAGKYPWLGRLPGDLRIHRGRTTILVPLATSILVSLVLTLILNLFMRR